MTKSSLHPRAPKVRTELVGGCGLILLDRPKALNALTADMIAGVNDALDMFEQDSDIRVVAIGSTRKGCFCAGGDIVAIRNARLAGRHEDADRFFADEFALNLKIAGYSKPYVALVDGVCMGGGLGLSVHGRHRIVTERLLMAMPETAIGYFPDIGASYFMNALPPGKVGLYLALTGARLSAADALYCGFATACVPHGELSAVTQALTALDSHDVEQAIARWRIEPASGELEANRRLIDLCFAAETVVGIRERLRSEAAPFSRQALEMLDAASPHSLEITFELLKHAKGKSLAECLELEEALARRMTRGPDFAEGVRAVLIDKDRQPRWSTQPRS